MSWRRPNRARSAAVIAALFSPLMLGGSAVAETFPSINTTPELSGAAEYPNTSAAAESFPNFNLAEEMGSFTMRSQRRLGAFYISAGLSHDLSSTNASERWLFGALIAEYLSAETRKASARKCGAYALATPFPYISVLLFAGHKAEEGDPNLTRFCVQTVVDLLYKSPINTERITALRDRMASMYARLLNRSGASTWPPLHGPMHFHVRRHIFERVLAPRSLAQGLLVVPEMALVDFDSGIFATFIQKRRDSFRFTVHSHEQSIIDTAPLLDQRVFVVEREAQIQVDFAPPEVFDVPEYAGLPDNLIVVPLDSTKAKTRWDFAEWDSYCNNAQNRRDQPASAPKFTCIIEFGALGERWLYVFAKSDGVQTNDLRRHVREFSEHPFVASAAKRDHSERAQVYVFFFGARATDPPPMKRSDSKYGFATEEDCNGEEATQAGRDRCEVAAG